MKRSLLVALLCLGLLSIPASAAEVEANDPDDVSGFLDLALLKSVAEEGGPGFFTIKTHEGFACNYLKPNGKNYLKLQFDDGRDGDIDLVGVFECADNKLMFLLHGKETGNNYEPLRAKRPKAKVTKVSFQLDLAEFESDTMGVIVRSKDGTNVDCDPVCKDSIPENGSLKAY